MSTAAPLSPRQLVLPGASGATYWWPPATTPTYTSASYITSSVLLSATSISTTPTTTLSSSSISSSSPSPLSAAVAPAKPFNFLYLIPIFAVVGLLILAGIIWLIHGCCTRKPKYRPPPLLPPPQNISFKAFRYEDISPADSLPRYIDEDPCRHVKAYGFQCDCRPQADPYDYHLPGDRIDQSDGKHVDEEEVEEKQEERQDSCLDVRLKDEAKDTRGFRMVDDDLITSTSPLSQLSTRIATSSNGSWMEKVVSALGSRFSSSSGKDEDRYTAIPESSASSQRRANKLVKKHAKKRKSKRPSTKVSSNHLGLSSDPISTTAAAAPIFNTTTTTSVDEEGEGEGVVEGRVVLLSQKRRLQNHRDSIASLPAGMVFSPPSVGFSVFGEEDAFGAAIRDKSVPRVLPR